MYRYTDMHCDTLMKAFFEGKPDIYDSSTTMLDIKRLLKGGSLLQFLAVFFPKPGLENRIYSGHPDWLKRPMTDDISYFEACRDIFMNTVKSHADEVAFVKDVSSYDQMKASGKMGVLLSMEDGRAAQGSMDRMQYFFKQDVRAIALTWNHENCFGFPNSMDSQIMNLGLKPFGKEAVEYMNEAGMLVDVSHLSDGGFYDVDRIVKGPFIASHSNCRSVMDHRRNMTDDMIRRLGEHGGVMGLNWAPEFVAENGGKTYCDADALARHALHAVQVGGIDILGIGTDFDGTDGDIEIDNPAKMYLLWEALERAGFHESEIDKISHANVERVLREVLP